MANFNFKYVVDYALENSIKRRLAGGVEVARFRGGVAEGGGVVYVLHSNFCTAASTRFEWMDGSMNLTLAE